MARLDAKWDNFDNRGNVWDHFWTDTPAATTTNNYSISCTTTSYSLSPVNADLTVKRNYTLACTVQSYSLASSDVTFAVKRVYTLAAQVTAYNLSSIDTTLTVLRNYSLSAVTTEYDVVSRSTGLQVQYNYTLAASTTQYVITTKNVILTNSATSTSDYLLYVYSNGSFQEVTTSMLKCAVSGVFESTTTFVYVSGEWKTVLV